MIFSTLDLGCATKASQPSDPDARLCPQMRTLQATLLAVGLHAVFLGLVFQTPPSKHEARDAPKPDVDPVVMAWVPPTPPATPSPPPKEPAALAAPPRVKFEQASIPTHVPTTPQAQRPLASMDAPPAPTAEEWAFAARYPLKNSKGYRHAWGQQVRSMMGTAVEGPEQGVVRFRIEISPDGRLASLETLWATSPFVEQHARQAIENLPPLPPTPTGQPLVFEKTITFTPFATDVPPMYKDDCLPDPPKFRNRFTWNGQGPSASDPGTEVESAKAETMPLEDCLKLLPQDSMDAEMANDQRQLERWGSSRLGR